MPFKASDIKVTIKTKKVINLFKVLGVWHIQIASYRPHYFFAIWLITHIRVYWINNQKTFPYFKLKRVAI